MMDAPTDKNTSARQRWIQHEQRRMNRARWRGVLQVVAVWCVFVAVLITGVAHASECDGFGVEVGVGAHARGWDAPEYTTRNPLGTIELSYKRGRARFVLSHTSSLEGFPAVWDSPHEYGYGNNTASVRWALW